VTQSQYHSAFYLNSSNIRVVHLVKELVHAEDNWYTTLTHYCSGDLVKEICLRVGASMSKLLFVSFWMQKLP